MSEDSDTPNAPDRGPYEHGARGYSCRPRERRNAHVFPATVGFGRHHILMGEEVSHRVAIIYRGEDRGSFEPRATRLSEQIDLETGDVLESWDGVVPAVKGIRHLLQHLWDNEGFWGGSADFGPGGPGRTSRVRAIPKMRKPRIPPWPRPSGGRGRRGGRGANIPR